MKYIHWRAAIASILGLLVACDDGPRTIPADPGDTDNSGGTGVFSGTTSGSRQGTTGTDVGIEHDLHTVVAQEVLPTVKYVYVRVKEGEEQFWIAATRQEIVVGRTYFYRGGLLKTDFHSKEHDRTFDRLYLVSSIVPADHGNTGAGMPSDARSALTQPAPTGKVNSEGSVKIADLVSNPKKYAGKSIQVSGICSKVNPNIMGRNWIHLQDGSRDDYDLVITTDVLVPEGHAVTMVGTVALGKDFGAGYKYDILLEGGTLVK